MSIYSYSPNSSVSSITFRTTENGSVRAYLQARDGAAHNELASALKKMQGAKYSCTPFHFKGQPMLEVRGFGSAETLTDTLKPWLSGTPSITQESADKVTWGEWFRKRTLQLSGASYLIGDYGFMKYGYKEADNLVMSAAFSYFLGTLALIGYGRNDQSDLQVRDMAHELEGFLCADKKLLPKDSALHAVLEHKEQSLLEKANEFGKRFPSEIFNTVTAIAGVFVAASAFKNKIKQAPFAHDAKGRKEMLHEGWMDLGLGTITALSGIFATVVKEKKPDPDEPKKTGIAGLWQKIQAHPLAIAGGGYSIATMCHAGSTWKAYKEAKRTNDQARLKSVPNRALFVLAALTSEFLLAISSKGHGEGVVSDNSIDNTTLAIAADFIARQPHQNQQALIEETAKFLGDGKHLAMKNEDIVAILRDQIASIQNNPWMAPLQKQYSMPASAFAQSAGNPNLGSWRQRMAFTPQVTPYTAL